MIGDTYFRRAYRMDYQSFLRLHEKLSTGIQGGGTMGKGGSAAGGDGGGSGGGEGAVVVGLDGLAILFLPFFTIASDSTTCGDRMGGGGTIPKGTERYRALHDFSDPCRPYQKISSIPT